MNTRKKNKRVQEDIVLPWKARSSQNVYEVVLSTPTTGDLCNIMQEEITDAKLEWIDENRDYFNEKNPSAKKATLQCGHIFYVTALAYHFVKNQMVCPVCRAGEKNKMNVQCIPKRIRKDIVQRAQTMLQDERRQQEETEAQENQREINRIISEEVFVNFFVNASQIRRRNTTTMEITFLSDTPQGNYAHHSLLFLSMREHRGSPDNTDYLVPRSQIRKMRNFVETQVVYPTAMRVMIIRNGYTVARTGIMRVEALVEQNTYNVNGTEPVVTLCDILNPNHYIMQTATTEVGNDNATNNVNGWLWMETMRFTDVLEPFSFPVLNLKWSSLMYHMSNT